MFFLQRLGILREEVSGLCLASQADTSEQQQGLPFFLLVGRINVAIPGGGNIFGALFLKELLADLSPAKFPKMVLLQERPTISGHAIGKIGEYAGSTYLGIQQSGHLQAGIADDLAFKAVARKGPKKSVA